MVHDTKKTIIIIELFSWYINEVSESMWSGQWKHRCTSDSLGECIENLVLRRRGSMDRSRAAQKKSPGASILFPKQLQVQRFCFPSNFRCIDFVSVHRFYSTRCIDFCFHRLSPAASIVFRKYPAVLRHFWKFQTAPVPSILSDSDDHTSHSWVRSP